MTEQEAMIRFDFIRCALLAGTKPEIIPNEDNVELMDNAIKTLEEVEQYRAIGTVSELQDLVIGINALADSQFSAADMAKLVNDMKSLYEYQQIGTPEECRAAVEKQIAKKPIRNDKCTCPSCGTHNEVIKKRRNTVYSDIVYCWHCGQALKIFRCDE